MFKKLRKILLAVFFIIILVKVSDTYAWPRVGVVIAPRPVEIVTVRPGPNFVWLRGHYRFNRFGFAVWVPGHWRRI